MWEMSQWLGGVEESLHPAGESFAHKQRRGNLIVHLGWGEYCQRRAWHMNGWLELLGVPGGICLRESSLLSGTVWLCCFKSLLWALLEEITPLGQRGSGRCCQWGVEWWSCKSTTTLLPDSGAFVICSAGKFTNRRPRCQIAPDLCHGGTELTTMGEEGPVLHCRDPVASGK